MSNKAPSNPVAIFSPDVKRYSGDTDIELGHSTISYKSQELKVAELPPEVRAAFLTKVYSLLSLQLMVTWAMTYGVYYNAAATNYVATQMAPLVLSIIGTFVFLFMAYCYGTRYPHGYLILTGFYPL